MSRGAPAISRVNKKEPSGPPFTLVSAVNGASVDPISKAIVLGNNIGGAAAVLLSNREIPTAGFDVRLSGLGNFVVGSNAGIAGKLQIIGTANGIQQLTKLPAAQTIANAFYQVTDSANNPVFEMRTLTGSNLFIGANVGKSTTGVGNTAFGGTSFGATCFLSNTTGDQNTAIGSRCMQDNTIGRLNTAVGEGAQINNLSGSSNVAIGQAALAFLTASDKNVGVGMNSGHGAGAVFTRCTLLGTQTYEKVTAGDDNTIIGFDAAATNAAGAAHGAGNVVIGSGALAQLPMGARNVLIGAGSNAVNAVGNDTITIGANNSTPANNVTLIGSGMSSNIGNIAGLGIATQNVIIGQTAIAVDDGRRLQVNGGISFNDAAAMLYSTVAMTDGAGASLGTLANAPSAGNPTKWIPFNDNGTVRLIPAW